MEEQSNNNQADTCVHNANDGIDNNLEDATTCEDIVSNAGDNNDEPNTDDPIIIFKELLDMVKWKTKEKIHWDGFKKVFCQAVKSNIAKEVLAERDDKGNTLLMCLCYIYGGPRSEVVEMVMEVDPELIHISDADNNNSCLHNCIEREASIDIIKYFIEKDPEMITKENQYKMTPLHLYLLEEETTLDVVKLLVERGPRVTSIRNISGRTPLDIAREENVSTEIIKYLSKFSSGFYFDGKNTTFFEEGTELIADGEFQNRCKSVKDIVIPGTVSSIEKEAFAGCKSLKSVTILKRVTTTISNGAFKECTSLEEVQLSSSITTIDDYAFADCNKLKRIVMKFSVTSIGDYAFRECFNLEEVALPQSLMLLGKGAFFGCEKLTSVVIPYNVITINKETFFNCRSLNEIILPSKLKIIKEHAITNCSSLKEILKLPSTLKVIDETSFVGCDNLHIDATSLLEEQKEVFEDHPIKKYFDINIATTSEEKVEADECYKNYDSYYIDKITSRIFNDLLDLISYVVEDIEEEDTDEEDTDEEVIDEEDINEEDRYRRGLKNNKEINWDDFSNIINSLELEMIQKVMTCHDDKRTELFYRDEWKARMCRYTRGSTLLMHLLQIERGSPKEIIEKIVKACPKSVLMKDNCGETPIEIAAQNKAQNDVMQLLGETYLEEAPKPTFPEYPKPTHGGNRTVRPIFTGMTLQQFNSFIDSCEENNALWEALRHRSLGEFKKEPFVSGYDLNDYFVKAFTEKSGSCVALRINWDNPRRAQIMVSHPWGEDIKETQRSLNDCIEDKSTVIWFCIFANYQNEDGYGPSLTEQLKLEPFKQVISIPDLKGMVVVHSSKTELYDRKWCVHEIDEALDRNLNIITGCSAEYLDAMLWGNLDFKVDTARAQCSIQSDEEYIDSLVMKKEGGYNRLNRVIREFREKFLETEEIIVIIPPEGDAGLALNIDKDTIPPIISRTLFNSYENDGRVPYAKYTGVTVGTFITKLTLEDGTEYTDMTGYEFRKHYDEETYKNRTRIITFQIPKTKVKRDNVGANYDF